MNNRDILRLAYRNLKAGKNNVNKIVFSVGIGLMMVLTYIIILDFYKDYKLAFEEKFSKKAYIYKNVEEELSYFEATWIIDEELKNKEYPNASDVTVLFDIDLRDHRYGATPNDMYMILDGKEYVGKNYFMYERPHYATLGSAKYSIDIGCYSPEYNIFPETIYDDGVSLIGSLPDDPGEVLVDTYILQVYGFEGDPKEAIGKTISIDIYNSYMDEYLHTSKKNLCTDYVITGVFDAEELCKREATLDETSSWDYYSGFYNHIYINFKTEDQWGLIRGRLEIRYYYQNYEELVSDYDYAKIISYLQTDYDDVEYEITGKGMEICVFGWIVNNMGKLLGVLGGAIILVILFSLFYIVRFYFARNSKYVDMLLCIGMEQRDRIKLRTVEMLIMLLGAVLVALYMTLIFIILFSYVTNNFLSYGYKMF